MKKWLKITLISFGVLLLLAGGILAYLYIKYAPKENEFVRLIPNGQRKFLKKMCGLNIPGPKW